MPLPICTESLTWLIPQSIERQTRKTFPLCYRWKTKPTLPYPTARVSPDTYRRSSCCIWHFLVLWVYIGFRKRKKKLYALVVKANCVVPVCSLGENNILQVMVKVVKGVRPDLGAIPRCRPPACSGFMSLMQRCWTTIPQARPSFQSMHRWFDTLNTNVSFLVIINKSLSKSSKSLNPNRFTSNLCAVTLN